MLVITLLFVSIFNRNQKLRVALGFFYKKKPFEKADCWIEKDNRIENKLQLQQELKGIKNAEFFSKYYSRVKCNKIVVAKNAEYCVIRDMVFIIFNMVLVIGILTIFWPNLFWKELFASVIAYLIGVVSCRNKVKDFVQQIIVEYIDLKEE